MAPVDEMVGNDRPLKSGSSLRRFDQRSSWDEGLRVLAERLEVVCGLTLAELHASVELPFEPGEVPRKR